MVVNGKIGCRTHSSMEAAVPNPFRTHSSMEAAVPNPFRTHSSMDRVCVCGTQDAGPIPAGCTRERWPSG
jgi:hypothetical protein